MYWPKTMKKSPECARFFEQVTESGKSLQHTFRELSENPDLEARIFAGLAHQRAQGAARRRIWKSWIVVPVFASLLSVSFWGIRPWLQQASLNRDVASLLSTPPSLQIDSTDRNRLLAWSSTEVGGPPALPSDLSRVEFRGAAESRWSVHTAIFIGRKPRRPIPSATGSGSSFRP